MGRYDILAEYILTTKAINVQVWRPKVRRNELEQIVMAKKY